MTITRRANKKKATVTLKKSSIWNGYQKKYSSEAKAYFPAEEHEASYNGI
jgi:hypothetical protein